MILIIIIIMRIKITITMIIYYWLYKKGFYFFTTFMISLSFPGFIEVSQKNNVRNISIRMIIQKLIKRERISRKPAR